MDITVQIKTDILDLLSPRTVIDIRDGGNSTATEERDREKGQECTKFSQIARKRSNDAVERSEKASWLI